MGAESAAPFQLASGEPIMAIGGFNGTDQAPTLAQFKKMVAAHEVHYFIGANGHTFGGGSGDAAQITSWVRIALHQADRRRRDRLQPHQPHQYLTRRSQPPTHAGAGHVGRSPAAAPTLRPVAGRGQRAARA